MLSALCTHGLDPKLGIVVLIEGVWHVAEMTYLSTSDTACGLEGRRTDVFTTADRPTPDGRPRNYCAACFPQQQPSNTTADVRHYFEEM